jgi:hypothetical protein
VAVVLARDRPKASAGLHPAEPAMHAVSRFLLQGNPLQEVRAGSNSLIAYVILGTLYT